MGYVWRGWGCVDIFLFFNVKPELSHWLTSVSLQFDEKQVIKHCQPVSDHPKAEVLDLIHSEGLGASPIIAGQGGGADRLNPDVINDW